MGLVNLGVAAGQGSTIAAVYLGECFDDPDSHMVDDVDFEEAIRWTRLSLRWNQRETNPNHKLSEKDVASIRTSLAELQDDINYARRAMQDPAIATEEIVVVDPE